MSYTHQLQALGTAIIDTDSAAILPLIKSSRPHELSSTARLAIYTNGYRERLENATMADYPALAHYLGEDRFILAITAYISATASQHWDLNLYSIGFAQFLQNHINDEFAHALARLESAIAEIFWLQDSPPLDAQALAGLSFEQLASQHFRPRTASRLLVSRYAASDYLTAFRNGTPPETMAHQPEYLCIIRHENKIQRIALDAAEYALLMLLQQGESLGAALEKVMELPETDPATFANRLPDYLARWLSNGLFTDYPQQSFHPQS